jgi:hypothetical protein
VLPLRFYVQDTTPEAPPVRIQLDTDDEPLAIEAADGKVTARVGRLADPDLVLTGPAQPIGRLMLGRMNLSEARTLGVNVNGDISAFKRLRVKPPEGTEPQPTAAVSLAP